MNRETIEKILNRKEYQELTNIRYFGEEKILITGANGSIGTKLCEKLSTTNANVLATDIDTLDVTNEENVKKVINEFQPSIIINIAGAKHAPEGEFETEKTFNINTIGTRNILKYANGAKVILTSTCKSCNPETVYGASKLIAERMVLNQGGVIARFFNVIETQGNVFEIWNEKDKIEVANECQRHFISLSEAVGLIIFCMVANSGRYIVNSPQLIKIKNMANLIHPEKEKIIVNPRRGDRIIERFMGTNERKGEYFLNEAILKLISHND